MIVKFNVGCLGYSVGGHQYNHEIEIDDKCLEEMTEEEKEEFIHEQIYEYIVEGLDYGITQVIKEEE